MTPPNERDIREQEDHDLAEQQLAEHPPCGCGPETACDKHRATPTSPQRAADQQDRVGEVPITCICRHYLNGTVDALHDCPIHGEQPAAPVERGEPDKVREALVGLLASSSFGAVRLLADRIGAKPPHGLSPAYAEYIADALLALRPAPPFDEAKHLSDNTLLQTLGEIAGCLDGDVVEEYDGLAFEQVLLIRVREAFEALALRAAPSGEAAGEPRALFTQLVHEELERAYAKHGRDPWGRHEFYAILLEEVDELWDAIKANRPDADVHAEMVQVAAMCFRFWETGDRYAVQKEPEAHPLECLRQHLSVGETEDGDTWGLWCGGGERTPALYSREPQTEEEERKRDEGDPNWGPDVDVMLAEYAASLSETAAP